MENSPQQTKNNAEISYTDPQTGKFAVGNPGGGRPKGAKNFTTKVRDALETLAQTKEGSPLDISHSELLVRRIIQKAIAGDNQMIKLLWNYLDGLPMQTIKHEGEMEITLTLEQRTMLEKLVPPRQIDDN